MPYQQPRVPIGQRRTRVQVQSATLADDGMGGQTIVEWATMAEPWAQVIALDERDKEALAGAQLTAKSAYHIVVPYRTDLSVRQRVIWRDKTLEIMNIVDDENRGRRLTLQCEEVQT